MNHEQALSLLKLHLQPDQSPTLDEVEVLTLLDSQRVPDSNGLLVNAEGYTDTWSEESVTRAVADGWRIKASKCAGQFSFSTNGQSFSASDMFAHCQAQERNFRRGLVTSLPLVSPGGENYIEQYRSDEESVW